LKDLSFKINYSLPYSLLSILGIVLLIGGHPLGDFSIVMIPGIFFAGVIMKMCYAEDNYSTLTFLKSFPISKKAIVASKFVLSKIFIVIGILMTLITYFLMPPHTVPLHISHILVLIGIAEIYFATYLFLFFRFSYFAARIPPNILGVSLIIFCLNKTLFHTLIIPPILAVAFFVLALFINFLLMKLSIDRMR